MRDLSHPSVLILPGLGGSGPDHWQTHWEQAFPTFKRVEQPDWDKPVYADWAARLSEAVKNAKPPIVLVAHSLGTSLVMRWAFDEPELAKKVAGAFLVAPTDRDQVDDDDPSSPSRGFGKMILEPLPFAAMVVASRSDDRVSFGRAQLFAKAWEAMFIDAGRLGHMGSAAKLGVWPLGLIYFGQFLNSIGGGD